MKIAVVSPAGRSGATVATLLMGYALAYTQGRTVRLCYTGENYAIKRYVGRDTAERDATRTILRYPSFWRHTPSLPRILGITALRWVPTSTLWTLGIRR